MKVLERHPLDQQPERCGRCFPGGHASGGFALFALAGLVATRPNAVDWTGGGVELGLGDGRVSDA